MQLQPECLAYQLVQLRLPDHFAMHDNNTAKTHRLQFRTESGTASFFHLFFSLCFFPATNTIIHAIISTTIVQIAVPKLEFTS